MKTKQIAQTTVEALDKGFYQAPSGETVAIDTAVKACFSTTRCYDPDALNEIHTQVLQSPLRFTSTEFEVMNETSLQGAARLKQDFPAERIGVLNFASGKNPGGGFLGGAQAQEESLARSSGLYKSLLKCSSYYSFHRSQHTTLYSDRMIYSPDCPVLRDDDGSWLEVPYLVDFITSPAPNAGAIKQNEPHNLDQVIPTLWERGSKVLALAAHHQCDTLILGAWGCGVFKNDPRQVARMFWEHLSSTGVYWGRFRKVIFSVWDRSREQDTFQAFVEQFSA